jgi:CRISPR-associated protein Csy1
MSKELTTRATRMKRAIEDHLEKRIAQGVAKYSGSDRASEDNRRRVREGLEFAALLQVAIESEGQIQIATHIAKGVHPDLKVRHTTNLMVRPRDLAFLSVVGSHVLPPDVAGDSTGNGSYVKKSYELNLLLSIEFEGKSLRSWILEGDDDAESVVTLNVEHGLVIRALVSLAEPRCKGPASSHLAKQIYWQLPGEEHSAHEDSSYHLLAPLYPTTLVHRVYQQLRDDRFSDAAKAARAARKEGTYHSRPVREYPDLAIQKLGGTKPQNISQLNSERRGDNCLLASVPPVWKAAAVRPLWGVRSLFEVWGRRPSVQQPTRQLRRFLEGKPPANEATRRRVRGMVEALVDELIQLQAELLMLESGWTTASECELSAAQCAWLDPGGFSSITRIEQDADEVVATDFARWLNAQLRNVLPVGDDEFAAWRKLARDELRAVARELA